MGVYFYASGSILFDGSIAMHEDCCCVSCPSDCSACDPITATITGPTGDCDLTTTIITPTRTGCSWYGTAWFSGKCVGINLSISCNPSTGEWGITVEVVSCNNNRWGTYFVTIGVDDCPPTGTYSLPKTAGDCDGGNMQVVLS